MSNGGEKRSSYNEKIIAYVLAQDTSSDPTALGVAQDDLLLLELDLDTDNTNLENKLDTLKTELNTTIEDVTKKNAKFKKLEESDYAAVGSLPNKVQLHYWQIYESLSLVLVMVLMIILYRRTK